MALAELPPTATPSTPQWDPRTRCARSFPRASAWSFKGSGDLGERLLRGISDLLAKGYAGAILVNSDSPTLPAHILEAAVGALAAGDQMVIGPAMDGGYTLIGLTAPHARLFEDIQWSTEVVFERTMERARGDRPLRCRPPPLVRRGRRPLLCHAGSRAGRCSARLGRTRPACPGRTQYAPLCDCTPHRRPCRASRGRPMSDYP